MSAICYATRGSVFSVVKGSNYVSLDSIGVSGHLLLRSQKELVDRPEEFYAKSGNVRVYRFV